MFTSSMNHVEIHSKIEHFKRYLHCLILPNWLPQVIDTLNCKCKLKMHINYIQMKYSRMNKNREDSFSGVCVLFCGEIELKEQRNKDKIRAGRKIQLVFSV